MPRSNPSNPRQKTVAKSATPRWVKRAGVRLGVALLIFALCYVGIRWVPGVKDQAQPFLQNMLSCSCDFEEAVRCFSVQMEQGDDVTDALEEFCVTAFAVQPTGTSTSLQGEYAPFVNTLARVKTQ